MPKGQRAGPPLLLLIFQMNTFVDKCECCENRVLFIKGELLHADAPPESLIPVADLSRDNLVTLFNQLSYHLSLIKEISKQDINQSMTGTFASNSQTHK